MSSTGSTKDATTYRGKEAGFPPFRRYDQESAEHTFTAARNLL